MPTTRIANRAVRRKDVASAATLEERVSELERLIAVVLRQAEPSLVRKKDWQRTVGMFDGDPLMREIVATGHRIRDKERRKART